jgi:hypothetical protein
MQLVISRKWIGGISDSGSVAFELKHSFRFDIERDSGFKKTLWEKIKARLGELSLEVVKTIIQAIIAAALLYLGLKKS